MKPTPRASLFFQCLPPVARQARPSCLSSFRCAPLWLRCHLSKRNVSNVLGSTRTVLRPDSLHLGVHMGYSLALRTEHTCTIVTLTGAFLLRLAADCSGRVNGGTKLLQFVGCGRWVIGSVNVCHVSCTALSFPNFWRTALYPLGHLHDTDAGF